MTAYNETCASVGGVYWAWRMFCLEKRAEYVDVLERMILNVNLAAVSMDGRRFFYENMLRRAKKLPYELIWGQERAEYILSYCCPPNLARLMAQMSEYAYAVDKDGIYTLLYGASRARVAFPGKDGEKQDSGLILVQETGYPYDGNIRFTFEEEETQALKSCGSFSLHLRIPSWVRNGTVRCRNRRTGEDEESYSLSRKDGGTYICLRIEDPKNREILVDFAMKARLTCAHPLVEEDSGQVAVERGPLVYCIEGMDAAAETLDDLMIPSDIRLEPEDFVIEGRTVTSLKGSFLLRKREDGYDRNALYQDYGNREYEEITARMIPYFAWDNRGMDEMRVWLPVMDAGERRAGREN